MAVAGKSGVESKGMTSVEFLISTVMLGILCATAVPGILGSTHHTGVNRASRRLTEDLRLAQSNGITRGAQTGFIVFDQSGVVPDPGNFNDPIKANKYRIELQTARAASWPSLINHPSTDPKVVTVWKDTDSEYRGVCMTTGSPLVFNPRGFS